MFATVSEFIVSAPYNYFGFIKFAITKIREKEPIYTPFHNGIFVTRKYRKITECLCISHLNKSSQSVAASIQCPGSIYASVVKI